MSGDVFPVAEKRRHDSMGSACHKREAAVEDLATVAPAERPFRSWVSVPSRTAREDDSHQIRAR